MAVTARLDAAAARPRRPVGDLEGVQRIVLQSSQGSLIAHELLRFESARAGRDWLRRLFRPGTPIAFGRRPGGTTGPELSVGLTFEGLRALLVPQAYLGSMAVRARAFAEGAAARAAERCGDTRESAVSSWSPAFIGSALHAIVSLAGDDASELSRVLGEIGGWRGVERLGRWRGARLTANPTPPSVAQHGAEKPEGGTDTDHRHWVHFGYRDGLSAVAVEGFPPTHDGFEPDLRVTHAQGEFILGRRNDQGSDLWSFPNGSEEIRDFFADGSFGVLRVIEQKIEAFEAAVARWAHEVALAHGSNEGAKWHDFVKAKLCGRWPDGRHFDPDDDTRADDARDIRDDFDHSADAEGHGCPIGSHMRRMNARERDLRQTQPPMPGIEGPVHARTRALLRRGLPYGAAHDSERGLLGWFFCADIDQQFEHLLGQWADRNPLGPDIRGSSKDPLIGLHEDAGSDFVIRRRRPPAGHGARDELDPIRLSGFQAFCRTRGMAYAFYPGRTTLERISAMDYPPPADD